MTDIGNFENLNIINIIDNNEKLKKDKEKIAYDLAKISHAFETRKSGEPYFEGHSVKVADIVLKKWFDDENFEKLNSEIAKKIIEASYLHDTVEDTILTSEWIVEIFDDEMGGIIEALTENKEFRGNIENQANREGKDKSWVKKEMLFESLRKINELKNSENKGAWEIAASVRVADIIQNLSDYDFETEDEKKKKLQERNLEKAKIIFEEFDGEIDLTEVLRERIGEIKDKLGIKDNS